MCAQDLTPISGIGTLTGSRTWLTPPTDLHFVVLIVISQASGQRSPRLVRRRKATTSNPRTERLFSCVADADSHPGLADRICLAVRERDPAPARIPGWDVTQTC
jgi:hypothetical protein